MDSITPMGIVASYHINKLIELMESNLDDAFDYFEDSLDGIPEEVLSYIILDVASRIRLDHPAKYILFLVFLFGSDEEAVSIVDAAVKGLEKTNC